MNTLILYGLAAMAALGALFGMYKVVDARGYDRGVAITQNAWQARELKEVAAFDAKFKELTAAYRTREEAWKGLLAAVDVKYQKELIDAKAQREADVAALRSGAIRLRARLARTPPCEGAGGSAVPGSAASAGGGDGAATAELSRQTSEDLLALGNDADEVTRQLAACQAVVEADRVTVNR